MYINLMSCSPGDGAIDARLNWWGSELRSFISGKIWDETDKNNLVRVEFWQPKLDNRTVVEGIMFCITPFCFNIPE